MTRDDDDRDEELATRGAKGSGSPVGLLVVAAVVLLACGGGAVVLLGLFWLRPAPAPVLPNAPGVEAVPARDGTRQVYTRAEFGRLVFGKTKDEVTELLGPPDETEAAPFDKWTYTGRTQVTGFGVDGRANLLFTDGKVSSVDYWQ